MHLNLVRLKLCLQLECKLLNSTFRTSVGCHAWDSLFSRAWVTNKSNTPTLASIYHSFGDRMHEIEHSEEVEFHVMVVGADVAGQEHRRFTNRCAADDHIDLAPTLLYLL